MKILIFYLLTFAVFLSAKGQEQKVEIVLDSFYHTAPKTNEAFILTCNAPGIVVQYVSADYYLPFKLYEFSSKKENWLDIQSIYNTLTTKVPSISILPNIYPNRAPSIKIRGEEHTIIVVDGIRYDASILNTLNPANIESINVAPSAAATHYLLNN